MPNSNDKKVKVYISLDKLASNLKSAVSAMQDLGNIDLRIDYIPTNNESKETQLINLRESYRNQKLVLVLGSGSSKAYGLPDWDTLLQKLLMKSLESESEIFNDSKNISSLIINLFSPSRLILARNIQLRCKNNNLEDLSFEKDVRDVIYEEIDDTEINPSFKEIRQFCIAPGKSPNLDSIITFNYDDTLENCLSQLEIEIPFKSIYSAGVQPKVGELPIYHVHGFLPRNGKLDSKNKITLSEDLYHQLYKEIYCWSNIVQINKYTNNTCLFIGTSFTDPNLRRLLDVAKEQKGDKLIYHYIIRKRHNEEKIKNEFSKIISKPNQGIDDSEEESNRKIEENVYMLIRLMERYEEEDALSFGVSIIWVDNYDEIPTILSKIRNS